MPHICGRWSTQRSTEILTAFFNAVGYVAWENIWGIWNGVTARDGELLWRVSRTLRHFHPLLSDLEVEWLPFYPVKSKSKSSDHVFASKFVGKDQELWLIINTANTDVDASSWQLQVPSARDHEYYDMYHGAKLTPNRSSICLVKSCSPTDLVSVPLEPRSVGVVLKVLPGKLSPRDSEHMAIMQTRTSKALASFSSTWGPVPKQSIVTSLKSEKVLNPTGMVHVVGSPSFEFRIQGTMIEWLKSSGPERIGADVQYPWEDLPRMLHKPHSVSISDLWVDKHPVTNQEFGAFLRNSGYVPTDAGHFLQHWGCLGSDACSMPPGIAKQPVVFVSIEDARSYCIHAGKRLPHEWEWQYVAQGGDPDKLYPWGSIWRPEIMPAVQDDASQANMVDVGLFPGGASRDGVEDLLGLVWQWADEYVDAHTRGGVLRGGSAFQPQHYNNSRYQAWYFPGLDQPIDPVEDENKHPKLYSNLFKLTRHGKYLLMAPSLDRAGTIGFRCVADVTRLNNIYV